MLKKALLTTTIVLTLSIVFAPSAMSYERYNDGCQNCHGAFDGGTSPQGTQFPSNDKHEMHRGSQYMNTDCDLCHMSGDNGNPWIGESNGTANNPGIGCVGCHSEYGLRAHHTVSSVGICAGCHTNDDPPLPENTLPTYYGTSDTNANTPCNPDEMSNINENWSVGDFFGLDNDGDDLYDGDDPDCMQAIEEDCWDGIDNNDNGLVDCEDPDCDGAQDGECDTGLEGVCAAGTRTCMDSSEQCIADEAPGTEGPFGDAT
jgi:hypothetical protein